MICCAGRDRLAHDLADDLDDRPRTHPGQRASTALTSVVTWSARMAAPSGMSAVATTVGSSVGTGGVSLAVRPPPCMQQDDADEGDDREEYPHEQDQTIGSLQVVSPR